MRRGARRVLLDPKEELWRDQDALQRDADPLVGGAALPARGGVQPQGPAYFRRRHRGAEGAPREVADDPAGAVGPGIAMEVAAGEDAPLSLPGRPGCHRVRPADLQRAEPHVVRW